MFFGHLWKEGAWVDAFPPSWPGLTRPSKARTLTFEQAPWGRLTGGHDVRGRAAPHRSKELPLTPTFRFAHTRQAGVGPPHCKRNGERGR